MEKNNFFFKNKSILTFLILELIALLAFNFGNISSYISAAGVILAVISAVFLFFIVKDKKAFVPLIPALVALLIIAGFGAFNGFSKLFDNVGNLVLFLSLPAFFILGFVIRKFGDVKPYTVLLIVGAAFGAITLFGLFSTLIEYGFFYSLIYKNTPYYYYNGTIFNVTEEMYWLNGFEFGEASINYGCLFAILSASYLPGLLFINPKENRNEFIETAAIGSVGLLTLLIIPNFKAILILAIVAVLSLIFKFFKSNSKIIKITKISVLVIVGFAMLFFLLALINTFTGFKFPGILNRIFVQNRIMIECKPILEAVVAKNGNAFTNLFGIQPLVSNSKVIVSDPGIFEVELLKEAGLFGAILFLAFTVFMLFVFSKYFEKSKDGDYIKSIILTIVFVFFIYESLFNTINPFTHSEEFCMFLRSPVLLVVLFIFGFFYFAEENEEEK